MLPVPTRNRLPALAQQYYDDGWAALSSKMDSLFTQWGNDIKNFVNILDPAKCPAILLDELDFYLEAGFAPGDSETTKRRKVYNAVAGHKKRGTWDDHAKPIIDAITGYSAALFTAQDSDDAIWLANKPTDPVRYWMTWQPNDGSDDSLGIWFVRLAAPVSYVVAGFISIDCHQGINTPVLTHAQIIQINDALIDDVAPAYMTLRLGYVNASGQYVVYPYSEATI